MRMILLFTLLLSSPSFAEDKFYTVSNLFLTNHYVIDYKENIDYAQYIPKNYLEISNGPIPLEYLEDFRKNEFYNSSYFHFKNTPPEALKNKVVHFISREGINHGYITGVIGSISYDFTDNGREISSSRTYGSLAVSSNNNGFAFVSDEKHDIVIEPIDLIGLKLSPFDGDFIVGSKGNNVNRSYFVNDKSEPGNSFIFLQLSRSDHCDYRAHIISLSLIHI